MKGALHVSLSGSRFPSDVLDMGQSTPRVLPAPHAYLRSLPAAGLWSRIGLWCSPDREGSAGRVVMQALKCGSRRGRSKAWREFLAKWNPRNHWQACQPLCPLRQD